MRFKIGKCIIRNLILHNLLLEWKDVPGSLLSEQGLCSCLCKIIHTHVYVLTHTHVHTEISARLGIINDLPGIINGHCN